MMDLRDVGPGSVPLETLRRYLAAMGWRVRGSAATQVEAGASFADLR